jgi:hypothetical protein
MTVAETVASGAMRLLAVAALLVGLLLGFSFAHLSVEHTARGKDEAATKTGGSVSAPAEKSTSSSVPKARSDGMVAIPGRYQLPGVPAARATASNSREWIESFGADKEKVGAFNDQHFDLYSINSPEQIAWMAQNGYPMPEDIIAAQAMSTERLRDLATAGNEKAAFLLRDRDLHALKDTFATYDMMKKSRSEFWQSDPAGELISQDQSLNAKLMQESKSPYKGYLAAMEAELSTDPVEASSKIAAGLLWSESLGDFRVGQFLQNWSAADPLNATVLIAADTVAKNVGTNVLRMRLLGCPSVSATPIPGIAAPTE